MCGANRQRLRLYVSGRSAVCHRDSGHSAPTRRLISTERGEPRRIRCFGLCAGARNTCETASGLGSCRVRSTELGSPVRLSLRAPFLGIPRRRSCYRACSWSTARRCRRTGRQDYENASIASAICLIASFIPGGTSARAPSAISSAHGATMRAPYRPTGNDATYDFSRGLAFLAAASVKDIVGASPTGFPWMPPRSNRCQREIPDVYGR